MRHLQSCVHVCKMCACVRACVVCVCARMHIHAQRDKYICMYLTCAEKKNTWSCLFDMCYFWPINFTTSFSYMHVRVCIHVCMYIEDLISIYTNTCKHAYIHPPKYILYIYIHTHILTSSTPATWLIRPTTAFSWRSWFHPCDLYAYICMCVHMCVLYIHKKRNVCVHKYGQYICT
jgi:hypothetical protein